MNTGQRALCFIVLLALQFSLSANAAGELAQYIQSLSNGNQYASTLLPVGTQAQILETQALNSGNYGMYVNVLNGANKGNNVWVNYEAQAPMMNFYASQTALANNQATSSLDQAKYFLSTMNMNAFRAPANAPISKQSAVDIMNRATEVNDKLHKVNTPGDKCEECELRKLYATDTEPAFSEAGSKREPVAVNHFGIQPSVCHSFDNTLDACTYIGDSSPGRFVITNRGPNAMVSAGTNRYRGWSFEAPGFATQDMMLKLTDSPNSSDKAMQESYIMFFPRKALPDVRVQGDKRIATLPTGETVVFDSQGKILSGPLSENGALTQGQAAKVSYSGSGITLRVDAAGTDPRISKKSNDKAVISKQGRECKVPKKDLWPDQAESSAMHFKFPADKEFNAYLQQKCGFGLN